MPRRDVADGARALGDVERRRKVFRLDELRSRGRPDLIQLRHVLGLVHGGQCGHIGIRPVEVDDHRRPARQPGQELLGALVRIEVLRAKHAVRMTATSPVPRSPVIPPVDAPPPAGRYS